MSPRPRSAAARAAALLLAAGISLGAVSACTLTSDNVSCSGSSCTVSLTGDGAKADILGNALTFAGVKDGRATLSVGDNSISCAQGEKVSAGPLTLECTKVTDKSVELTASLS
jgi:hypothetical protein